MKDVLIMYVPSKKENAAAQKININNLEFA